MTEVHSLVRSFNNNILWLKLTDISCNIMINESTVAAVTQSIIKEISDTTQMQIIENLSLLGNQLSYLPNNFSEYVANLVYLDLSNNQLTNLPDSINILKKLTYLNLNNNQFAYLPNVVCELISLKTLKACQNCIKEVPNDLVSLSKLEDLDLSSNSLKCLPNSYTNLYELKNLSLANNCFQIIPQCIADGMENLRVFNFSQNYGSKLHVPPKSRNLNTFYAENNRCCPIFPNWILNFNYKNLEIVSLNYTKFNKVDLPENPTRSNIKRLSMKQCMLFKVTVENIIAEMTSLEELIIGNTKYNHKNYFWTMPIETIKEPFNLKKLDVCNTGISTLPNIISKFVNLSVIDISYNNMLWLPEEICSLKNLNSLIVHNNQLTAFPKNIGQLVSLKELKACCNHLYELPEGVSELSNLQYLDLYDNELETIPETITKLPNLIGVDLEQNYFSTDDLSLNRDAPYESMRDDLRKYWQYKDRTFNGFKLKLSNLSETLSDNVRKLSISSTSTSTESSLVDHYTNYSFPEGTYNQVENERWDTSEDSADEFDPHESKEPRKRTCSPFMLYKPSQNMYCPAESHQPRVITRVMQMLQDGSLVWSSNSQEGQFEDC